MGPWLRFSVVGVAYSYNMLSIASEREKGFGRDIIENIDQKEFGRLLEHASILSAIDSEEKKIKM